MNKIQFKKDDLILLLNENIKILNKYSQEYNYHALYNNEILYHACIRRTNIICRLLLLYKQYNFNTFNENEFTKIHFADVWFFVYKKIPDIELKLNRI
jgi:uncharacterized protein with HEPN domain